MLLIYLPLLIFSQLLQFLSLHLHIIFFLLLLLLLLLLYRYDRMKFFNANGDFNGKYVFCVIYS